ncbi:MAG: hypothetical protein ACLTYN_01925 [Dysosmobacter welbionis]
MPAKDVVFTATTDGTVTPDECTYTVVYHYVDRDGNEETETDPKDRPSTAGTPVSGLYDTNRTSHSDSTYIFDRAELNDVEIIDGETLQAGHNSIDVYYDIDELGPDDEPDGTPTRPDCLHLCQCRSRYGLCEPGERSRHQRPDDRHGLSDGSCGDSRRGL